MSLSATLIHLLSVSALLAFSRAVKSQNGGSSDLSLEWRQAHVEQSMQDEDYMETKATVNDIDSKVSEYIRTQNIATSEELRSNVTVASPMSFIESASRSGSFSRKPPSDSLRRVEELTAALAGPGHDSSKSLADVEDAAHGQQEHDSSDSRPRGNLRANGKATTANPAPFEAASTATESSMESTLMDLLKQGGSLAGTPFGKSVDQIRHLIEKDMMPKVMNAHKENQAQLNKLAYQIGECGRTKDLHIAKADKKKAVYLKTSPLHKTCREGEAGKHTEIIDCLSEERDKKRIMGLKCKEFAMVSKRVGDQQANTQIVKRGGSEGTESYVRRMTSTICGRYPPGGKGGGGKDGFLDHYMIAKEGCERATKHYQAQVKKCKMINKEYKEKKAECDSLQEQMDHAACGRAVEMKDACEAYSECYFDRRKVHDNTVKMVRLEEKDRKAEWKGLKRMQCLMDAFGDKRVTNDEIKKCKEKAHDTSHLIIKYPRIPSLMACTVPLKYPSSPEYKLAEFANLPALAKGNADATQCTGVVPISTEPTKGSPATCKCQRVTLNGPYSAGPLVKCTNCTDIRRSEDKNSCPEGTKLFSPRSEDDWRTIIASVEEVSAPNFIVDITRPQNGCGYCQRRPMNSQPNAQGSQWRTSDGSPWWLRSTRFKEPSGDYLANCYLGLQKPFDNAATLRFNDHQCHYHSKSYFCQLREQSVKPKRGSPAACKCENVALTGPYSAGALIKCTGCIPVSRSTQKNSCPLGTKLFSPANARDWKTILASAQPLRSPHFIIDITRPQNGCGGCSKYAMNSRSPPQMTWRTSDGSPWWLRSSKYTQPSHDYLANCYMDLFKPPPSENSVNFKTKKCSFFSNAYYCQPVKKKQKPPPPPPPVAEMEKPRRMEKKLIRRKVKRKLSKLEKLKRMKAKMAKEADDDE